jgi:glucan phosphoethanolaminetransferase (alkaline phosphatase superfamily)
VYFLWIVVCPFVLFLLVIVLSVLRYTDSDYPRDLARILRPLVTFAEHIFFKIMNKQEYNELNLIISYVALLVSNGD